MSESWRNILERAAGNLSIELDQMAAPAFSHAPAVSFRARRLSPQLSFAESRELLARELQAFSPQPQKTPPAEPRIEPGRALTVPVMEPIQKKQPVRIPRKRTPWQNLFATVLSAVITGGMTAYLLLAHGGVQKEQVLAFAAYVDQNFRSAGEASNYAAPVASASVPAVANRATEDSLIERASFQLKHGDGEGGRAVFEVLASHGSVRGAFALAETYDPAKLAQHADWQLKPDIRLARQWYNKASELGSLPAYERLRDLDKRNAQS
jgi:hypothetical protein